MAVIAGDKKLELHKRLMRAFSDQLGVAEEVAVEFLEGVRKAYNMMNAVSGIGSLEVYEICRRIDELTYPICPDCKVRTEPFITSPAQLYDPSMAELPGGLTTFWTGEWVCPKCRHTIASGREWWKNEGGSD